MLRILYVTSECAPLVKTGGLADVAGALPAALRRLGLDARVLLPGYPLVLAGAKHARVAARIEPFARLPAARLLEAQLPGNVPAWIVECPALYDRAGGPYQDARGVDWPDNALRFALLSHAAALLGTPYSAVDWRADVVHANDWQSGLAPAYNALRHGGIGRCAITIHNVAFQGVFEPRWMSDVGLPASSFTMEGVEYYGRLSFLKAGLYYAHAITTVSPTYAVEIQREPLGMGLHGLLATRRDDLIGILNGIDTAVWNPATDPHIAARYDARNLDAKRVNKRALQARLGLEPRDVLLLGSVGRLTEQKGVDLLLDAAADTLALPAQIAIVGTGERTLERRVQALAATHPGRVAAFIGFDEALAHAVEAGADAFVMPSRFEPSGMNQMYSQRYGTPPIVHATGGLVDSVVNCTAGTLADGTATGFQFTTPTRDALFEAIERCARAWDTPGVWRAVQRNGMARDFGWDAAAGEYAALYSRLALR